MCAPFSRGLSQSRPRRTPLLKANHKKARLEFAKMHIDKPQGFWENVLLTDETKQELFGNSHHLHVQRPLCERAFRCFGETANPDNGLIPDRYPTPSYSSIAAVGFGLTTYPVGVER